MTKAWVIHSVVLFLLAAVGIPLTVADLSSHGLFRGVGTFYYWVGYLILAVSTTAFFVAAHLALKRKRPLAARDFVFTLHCGTDAGVAFVYRTDVQAEPGTDQHNHSKVVRPLPAVQPPEPQR